MKIKNKSIFKFFYFLLLLSIVFNEIALESIGNIYRSTIVLFCSSLIIFFIKPKEIINKLGILILMFFTIIVISSSINVLFDSSYFQKDIVRSILYFQIMVGLLMGMIFSRHLNFKQIFIPYIVFSIFCLVRIYMFESDRIFEFSTHWDYRIQGRFASGANTLGVIFGSALMLSIYYIRGYCKWFLIGLFTLAIFITMSRGALMASILSIIIVYFYNLNSRKIAKTIGFIFLGLIVSLLFLYVSFDVGEVYENIYNRFFIFLDGNTSANDFSAGRVDLFNLFLNLMKESSLFEIFFGHGNGSINYYNPTYSRVNIESFHFVFLDIIYCNGLLIFSIYFIFILYIILNFIVFSNKAKTALFALFIFYHLELMVNPMVFSAQAGWLYSLILMFSYFQNKLIQNEK